MGRVAIETLVAQMQTAYRNDPFSALRRNVETSEVADACAFLLSDAGKGITGEVLIVDAGYHITGM